MSITTIIEFLLKVIALGMGIASVVLGFFPIEVDLDSQITFLGIGLLALAIASIMKK
ncbi:MAG: hypothetical protein ACK2TS_05620 [Anaerolineales bacterium]